MYFISFKIYIKKSKAGGGLYFLFFCFWRSGAFHVVNAFEMWGTVMSFSYYGFFACVFIKQVREKGACVSTFD